MTDTCKHCDGPIAGTTFHIREPREVGDRA